MVNNHGHIPDLILMFLYRLFHMLHNNAWYHIDFEQFVFFGSQFPDVVFLECEELEEMVLLFFEGQCLI
jgi:hypothetical protein